MAWRQETSSCMLGVSISTRQLKPCIIYIIWPSWHELFPCSLTRRVTRLALSDQISAAVVLVMLYLVVACQSFLFSKQWDEYWQCGDYFGIIYTRQAILSHITTAAVFISCYVWLYLLQWLWVHQPQKTEQFFNFHYLKACENIKANTCYLHFNLLTQCISIIFRLCSPMMTINSLPVAGTSFWLWCLKQRRSSKDVPYLRS